MSQELAHSVVKSTKYVILDTDMGTDDVWALIMLLKAERSFSNIKLLAITCVHGNTSMANVITNTFAVLDIMERTDIPVYTGATEALIRGEPIDNPFNGSNGLGGINVESFASDVDGNERVQPQSAIEIIHKLVMERPHEVSLICIGPLTNLALALKTYSDIRDNIKEVFVMGGNSGGVGNISSSAEYNFFADPESAYIALETLNCPITIVPWETCIAENISISMEWRFEIVKNVTCKWVELINLAESICYRDCTEWIPTDAYLMAAFLFPEMSVRKTRHMHATVELSGKHTRGQMVIDHLRKNPPNVTVVDLLHEDGCKRIFEWTVTSLN